MTRLDVAGAFGDVGVLFPIAIALITLNHLNPTSLFLAAGLTYCIAGWYFQIPIAVQPFKAVAAIALALSLSPSEIASAGLLMGILLLFVGITDLAGQLAKLFTLPIVRGIQLGLGLVLLREGLRLITGTKASVTLIGGAPASWLIAIAGIVVVIGLQESRRCPAAIVLLGLGVIAGLLLERGKVNLSGIGPIAPEWLHPKFSELKKVLPLLVIPQFALTFGNSVVATENTAQILYGQRAQRVTARALSISIGVLNVVTAFIEGAPLCHGSGGITAHHRFGARTPKSSYLIGGLCIVIALFGKAAVALLHVIPLAVLGVFLAYVGVQHAGYLRDIARDPRRMLIALGVGLLSFLSNLMWGFLLGFTLEGISRIYNLVAKRAASA
jgi:SulP family sulfate permease